MRSNKGNLPIFPYFLNYYLFCKTNKQTKSFHGVLWQLKNDQWDGKQITFTKYYKSLCKYQPVTIKTVEAHFFT